MQALNSLYLPRCFRTVSDIELDTGQTYVWATGAVGQFCLQVNEWALDRVDAISVESAFRHLQTTFNTRD